MDASEPDVTDLAGAILDGTPIDWRTTESGALETERPLLNQLRVLATLAEFHRGQRLGAGHREWLPRTWGPLRVLEPIGSGAFGHVYRAWDTGLDREVALKILSAATDSGDARASSIIQEGRLLARVRHPNVVTIYGAERIGDTVGLWMERIDGETVEERLTNRGPLPPSEAIEIAIQICHAVAAVHKAGLLHRDIKAQNVMLARDGHAVLMDFGTGWEVGDLPVPAAPLAGTPLYLAPELFRGVDATVASDIYSLGVLLYHMVTATYPVQGMNLRDLRLAHEHCKRTSVMSVRPDLPARLNRIIGIALDPNPEHRYESADAFAAALSTFKARPSFIFITYAAAALVVLALAVFWLTNERLRQPTQATSDKHIMPAASGVVRRSSGPAIAVLPLANRGSESGSEEFIDGFTEEIINNLAANGHLQVRSRASSFAFKNKPRDLREIAKQLDVGLVLEGSGRRWGRRFQIDAQLVQASTGVTLWTDSFESDLGDVFAARDRITRGVVSKLGYAPGRPRRRYDVNPEAYGAYLTARALVSRRGVDGPKKAVEFFQQVIALDPAFAPAYAGLADAYAYMSIPTYQGMPWRQAQGLMRAAATRALELDPNLAEAHAAMGIVHSRDRKWIDAQQEFEQALALNRSLSQVYTSYSIFTLRPLRKFDEAEQLVRLALHNDPLSLDVWRELAELQFSSGRYDAAIDLLQRVRAVDPELPFADVFLGRALAFRGRIDEALAIYDVMDTQQHPVPHYRAYAYVRAGRRGDAIKLAAENDQYAYRATIIYAALGDLDRAFAALDRTAESEPQRVPLLLTWPEMAPLRNDRRLAAFRARFGLP